MKHDLRQFVLRFDESGITAEGLTDRQERICWLRFYFKDAAFNLTPVRDEDSRLHIEIEEYGALEEETAEEQLERAKGIVERFNPESVAEQRGDERGTWQHLHDLLVAFIEDYQEQNPDIPEGQVWKALAQTMAMWEE